MSKKELTKEQLEAHKQKINMIREKYRNGVPDVEISKMAESEHELYAVVRGKKYGYRMD